MSRLTDQRDQYFSDISLIVLGRPALFDGALVNPKTRRLERMWRTVRAEQRAILAISSSLSASPCDLLLIIYRVRS